MHVMELLSLKKRVALVTGGSRGLGRQLALGLGEAGASVAITARREHDLMETAAELRSLGIRCLPVCCDIGEPDQVTSAVRKVVDEWGRLDILINNAGISWKAAPEDVGLPEWEKVMRINVTGTLLMSQAAGQTMISHRYGRIINIASVAGLTGARPDIMNTIAYNTSKGAVVNFTRDLACKWGRHGITVNCVAPGFFPTKMSRLIVDNHEHVLVEQTPLGRLGGEDDLKGLAVLLASDAAAHITGQIIAVDGGATVW